MAPDRLDRLVGRPVRSLEIFERDGRCVRVLRVFCPHVHASIDASVCTTCAFAHAVTQTAVTCAPPEVLEEHESAADEPLFLGPHAPALHTPLGAVCALRSVAVRVDVPVAHARRLLNDGAIVVVLTADDGVHGILSGAEPPEGLTSLGDMERRIHVLPESAALIEAIELMHGHVRLVPVTGNGGHFVGLVMDLDLLRWVARRRRSHAP